MTIHCIHYIHNYFGHFQVKLCRSYTALADVLSLFVVLPLMVRTLGFHDMTIVICAVSAHVRLMLDLINGGDSGD